MGERYEYGDKEFMELQKDVDEIFELMATSRMVNCLFVKCIVLKVLSLLLHI